MSLVSLAVGPNNPVTTATLSATLASLGVSLPPSELEAYTALLAGSHETYEKVLAMPDYLPPVDEDRFPRTNVHFPAKADNPSNAWAWKVSVKDKTPEGLLKGKTICLKDNVGLKGVPCLLGSDFLTGWTPNTDATICTRILEAGGEILGKAVCENLCLWGASFSAATGPIDNVYAAGYSAGGSSSGSAVLVARGDCDLGIGGDQGGSIRLPCMANGLVGLKPTSGLVPYTGIASLEQVIDHAGPMTKNVLDNALFLQVLAGVDGIDDRQQAGCPLPKDVPDYFAIAKSGVKGLRIGLLRESFEMDTADPRVSALVEKAALELRGQGAIVEDVSIPFHKVGAELWMVVCRISGSTSLLGKASGRRVHYMNDLTEKMVVNEESFNKLFPSAKNVLINGVYASEQCSPTLLGKAMNQGRRLKDEYAAALSKYDVLITPTVPWVTKTNAPPTATIMEIFSKSHGLTVNTNPFNLTGHPALTLPVGFLSPVDDSSVKLPIGMQIVGKWFDEPMVYRVAQAWESTHDWKFFA
ncbi:amidase, partial [Phenoliferia sp. Uapishka_3]